MLCDEWLVTLAVWYLLHEFIVAAGSCYVVHSSQSDTETLVMGVQYTCAGVPIRKSVLILQCWWGRSLRFPAGCSLLLPE